MVKPSRTILGERIRERRRALSMTQERLEELTGVSQSSIARLESGSTDDPKAATLAALAIALQTTEHYLRGTVDDPAATTAKTSTLPVFRNAPGWAEAAAEAKARNPWLPPEAIEGAGETNALLVPSVTAAQVLIYARAWLESRTVTEQEDLQSANVRAQIAEAEDRHARGLPPLPPRKRTK